MLSTNRFDRWTGWALPAIVALTPLVVIYVFARPQAGQTYVLEFAVFGLLLAHGVAWMTGWRRPPGRPRAPGWMIAALAATAAVSLVRSPAPGFSLRQCLLPASGLLWMGMVVQHPDRRVVLQRTSLALVAVAGLLSFHGILQHFGIEFLRFSSPIQKNRVIATIGHPNYLGSVLGPAVFFVLGCALTARRRAWRAAGGALIALVLLCITLAQTRGVWLGLIVGLGAAAVFGTRPAVRGGIGARALRRLAVGLGAIAAGVAAVVILLLPAVGAGIDLRARLGSEVEIKSRLYYWRAAVDLAYERPIFGQGYAMFDPLFWDYALARQKSEMGPFYYDLMPAISWRTPGHAHNEYLEVFCEQGLSGLAALLALLSFFLYFGPRAIHRESDWRRALFGACMVGAT